LEGALLKNDIHVLEELAKEARRTTIKMIASIGRGHIGGSLSIIELLTVLYYEVMNINPKDPHWIDRDRLVLSKGHSGPGLYSVLAMKGFYDISEITTLNRPGTNLPSHCDMNRTKGIDMTTGSLGQGLSAAVGIAIGAKIDRKDFNVYCIIGDGESQEGQIWEAGTYAASQKLNKLIAFTDNNNLQLDGVTSQINNMEPIDEKWRSFGWFVQSIDGHDMKAIYEAIQAAKMNKTKPSMIIMKTVKGKGWSKIEGTVGSHSMDISAKDAEEALKELA